MPTVRQVISDVRGDLNTINLDDWIPARYIHNKLIDNLALFLKREADDRRIYKYPDIWVTIDSFAMEQADMITCSSIAIPNCTKVMKSKEKLAKIFSTRYGYLLNINSLDFGRDYTQITPEKYKKTLTRRYIDPEKRYFWIYNDYLIIPNASVKAVTVRAMFVNKAHAIVTNSCDDCTDTCIKPLDEEFPCPLHLLKDVKDSTVIEIAKTRKSIPDDTYANLNDQEKKSPFSK